MNGESNMWTEKLKLNHTNTLVRGTCGPIYCNDSEWGRHAVLLDDDENWYRSGVYLIWIERIRGEQIELIYIGEGQIQERLCCWEEHNLGHYNHKGASRLNGDYPNEKPSYWCQYWLFDESDSVNAERHLMWLHHRNNQTPTSYNDKWSPVEWFDKPVDFSLPS